MNRDGRAAFLQVNDVHGYLEPHSDVFYESTSVRYQTAGGYSRIAHLVREARHRLGDSLIVLDGGDSLHGTRLVVASQGATAVPVLNELGFDAMTGHWEFGYGPAVLQQRLAELRHPFLALNVETKSGHPVFQPSMVKETPALRVGVIGLASNIVDKTMPPRFSDGLIFSLDPPALQQEVDRLRGSEGVDLVVLLSHLGLPQDLQLMSQVRHIGVCLSAHTHNRLERPIRAGDGLVIQSGAHGSFVGLLEVEVRSGQVVHAQHQLITVGPDLPEDPQMRDLISTLTASSRPELSERVGATEIGLDRGTVLEATMDNLLLESMREVAGTELAFSNGWRYGASIPRGRSAPEISTTSFPWIHRSRP